MKNQKAPELGKFAFKGNPVKVQKSKVPNSFEQGVGKRPKSTGND